MKLLIATDIHGSSYWAQRVADKFRETQADTLILLGDVYNHGPRNPFPRDYAPMKTAEILNSIADKIVAVKGNCDSEVDQMISKFPFAESCIVPVGGKRIFCTHGHVYNKDNLPALCEGDALICGHFHINEYVVSRGVHCVKLSSASLPKDCAAFCIVDDSGLCVSDFDGKKLFSVPFEDR